jgi:hypothetical protein
LPGRDIPTREQRDTGDAKHHGHSRNPDVVRGRGLDTSNRSAVVAACGARSSAIASTGRWCIGGQNCPTTVYAISNAPTTRRARLGGAEVHTIHPKATNRTA